MSTLSLSKTASCIRDLLTTQSKCRPYLEADGGFGREIVTLSGHTAGVYALAIEEGKLYSGSYDNTIKVWDV